MEIARKLKAICADLTLLAEQGNVEGFLNNVENADRLSSLLEDTRDAVMEYQVWTSPGYLELQHLMFELDFITTRHLRQELSDHRESPAHPIFTCA